jgi:hypothetical protein
MSSTFNSTILAVDLGKFNSVLWSCRSAGRRQQAEDAVGRGLMRKLVILCCGTLKSRVPFDPAWASKRAA